MSQDVFCTEENQHKRIMLGFFLNIVVILQNHTKNTFPIYRKCAFNLIHFAEFLQ